MWQLLWSDGANPRLWLRLQRQKGSKGSLGRGERANFTIQGQLRAFREAVPSKYKTEIGPEHVLMGLDGSAQCMGREQFSSERIWENAIT